VAKTMFCHPLMAHRAQILFAASALPGPHDRDNREDRRQASEGPDRIHFRSHDLQRAGAVCMRLKFHISPHATHRQYVDAFTFSLAALMVPAPQNGHV